MNPKTMMKLLLSLLVVNETLTDSQAQALLDKADTHFSTRLDLDDLSLSQLIDLLNGQDIEPPKPKLLV